MYTTIWQHGGHRVVAEGWAFADQRDYQAVLGALREVDVAAWLTAMPASVVRPDARTPWSPLDHRLQVSDARRLGSSSVDDTWVRDGAPLATWWATSIAP